MCVCVCVCVCVRACVRACVCVCVRACVGEQSRKKNQFQGAIYMYSSLHKDCGSLSVSHTRKEGFGDAQ